MTTQELREPPGASARIGLVAIGRNEGERLRACLDAAFGFARRGLLGTIVYVDSGSVDGSVAYAAGLGAHVVELDPAAGFTAGKARNAGAAALRALGDPEFIQFIDGDCLLVEGWLETGMAALDEDPGIAVVAGRRREQWPKRSIFNQLCDMEWNTPTGPTTAIGGDALYRAAAFHAVGGFDPAFICGEEPELNFRMRAAGWTILRLGAEMTRHDADITRWRQWWRRTERTGWAFAEGAATYGASAEAYNRRERRSLLIWGAAAPIAALLCVVAAVILPALRAPALGGLAFGALLVSAMVARIAGRRRRQFGDPIRHGLLYGALVMLGKPAEALGALRYLRSRAQGGVARIIEYKGAERSGPER